MFDIKGGASAIVTGGHPAAAGVFDVNDALRTSQKSRDVYDMIMILTLRCCPGVLDYLDQSLQ
jgi:hypothetical protein